MTEEFKDPFAGRFLDSEDPTPERFTALGHSGSDHYIGLETFPNPGCVTVNYTSDEVTAKCPITGQPDFYTVQIILANPEKCIESKSLKLFIRTLHEQGIFCEGLVCFIRDEVGKALEYDEEETMEKVKVTLQQKSRGGISITAIA